MSRSILQRSAVGLLAWLSASAFALEVSPDSPCASKCIDRNDGNPSWRNQSLTFNDMLPCYNWEYTGTNSTAAALKFQTCQECQMKSGYRISFTDDGTSSTEQDSTWFLFNNKAVVDFCIFGRFAEEQNKNIAASSIHERCSDSCSKIRSSIDYNIKSDPGGFDFCAHNTNANFTSDAQECAECVYKYDDLTILGNVLTTVQDMCEKKPGKNYTVPTNVSVYAAERINLTGTASSPSPSPPTSSAARPTASNDSSNGLSTGALAGIVLGGLLVIIAVLCLLLLLLKKRKNKAKLAEAGKGEELAAHTATPPTYQYNTEGPQAGKDRYTYAAEAPTHQPPVEMDGGRGTTELSAVGTPPARR